MRQESVRLHHVSNIALPCSIATWSRPLQTAPASPMPDIDSKDHGNCLECSQYAADIFTFFRRMEPHVRIQPDYINQQVCLATMCAFSFLCNFMPC